MARAQNGYVDHPRYGSAPRFTGVDADLHSADVHLSYRTRVYNHPMRAFMKRHGSGIPVPDEKTPVIIPGTAIVADLSRQTPATIQVTHYYDEEHQCIDCRRKFLFFAEEQRFWYEEKQFSLGAYCNRCYPCRRKLQDIERTKRQYEVLMEVAEPSADEEAQMAVARLALVEAGHFHFRQTEKVAAFLKRHPDHDRANDIRSQLEGLVRNREKTEA